MMRAVRYVQGRLGGTIEGPSGPFDEEALRREIKEVERAMTKAGFPPGFDSALQLF